MIREEVDPLMPDEIAQTPAETKEPAPWTFTVPMTLTANDVELILVTAFEGGIDYWGRTRTPEGVKYRRRYFSEALAFDRQPVEIVDEEEDGKVHTLDADALTKGLALYIQHRGWPEDLGNIDTAEADCIIQYALFGDVIYG